MLQRFGFLVLLAATLTPWVNAPLALVAGVAFALLAGNPFPQETQRWQSRLLQVSVVGLGASMNLSVVARVGASGALQTLVSLVLTLGLALVLARILGTARITSILIGVGTAICGGSAIAAVAPVIGAKSDEVSVSLAVVFLLNAAALVLFPLVGTAVGLAPEPFGLWSALAIHDTSSVVGASSVFGPASLAVGTTVKLARALWIIPLTFALARLAPRGQAAGGRRPRPWFILGFVVVAALVTYVPVLREPGELLASGARRLLVATLFLVGAGVSRSAVAGVGPRPLILGVALWLVVASATLAAILGGLLEVPALSVVAEG